MRRRGRSRPARPRPRDDRAAPALALLPPEESGRRRAARGDPHVPACACISPALGVWAGSPCSSLVFAVVFVPIARRVGVGGRARRVGGRHGRRPPSSRPDEPRRRDRFDFRGALDRTPGSREDLVRWLEDGDRARHSSRMFVATVLARWALRGGARRADRGPAPRGAPPRRSRARLHGGDASFWNPLDAPWIERTVLRSALALTARFLPFALLAAWVALRQVRQGHEEAAALLGARAAARAWRIWGPARRPRAPRPERSPSSSWPCARSTR